MTASVEYGFVRVTPGPDQVKGKGGRTWCGAGDGYRTSGHARRGLSIYRGQDMRRGIVGQYKVVVRQGSAWVDW